VSDEELLLGSDEEETEFESKKPSNKVRQLREAYNRSEESRKALEAAKAEIEVQLAEARLRAAAADLRDSGLSKRQAEVFVKSYGTEFTPEAINEFKTEVLGIVPEESVETEEPEERTAPAFVPTPTGQSAATKREYTSAEWNELRLADPIRADKALREGRVKHKQVNPGGPAF
jgi:hypothetical protein